MKAFLTLLVAFGMSLMTFKDDNDPKAKCNAITSCINKEDYKSALDIINNIKDINSLKTTDRESYIDIMKSKGLCHYRLREVDKAASIAKDLLSLYDTEKIALDENAYYIIHLANNIFFERGYVSLSLYCLQQLRSLQIVPSGADAMLDFQIAQVMIEVDMYTEAANLVNKYDAYTLFGESFDYAITKGIIMLHIHKFNEAEKIIQTGLTITNANRFHKSLLSLLRSEYCIARNDNAIPNDKIITKLNEAIESYEDNPAMYIYINRVLSNAYAACNDKDNLKKCYLNIIKYADNKFIQNTDIIYYILKQHPYKGEDKTAIMLKLKIRADTWMQETKSSKSVLAIRKFL